MYNELGIIILHYFVLYNSALTLKISKMTLNLFCDEILHMQDLKNMLSFSVCFLLFLCNFILLLLI